MKEIVKSLPMMIFIGFVLGFTYLTSLQEANNTKKDLNHTNEPSQIICNK